MHEYTGSAKDPQRHHEIIMTKLEITECVKKMLDEPVSACSQTGLAPFCVSNKPPAVSSCTYLTGFRIDCLLTFLYLYLRLTALSGNVTNRPVPLV